MDNDDTYKDKIANFLDENDGAFYGKAIQTISFFTDPDLQCWGLIQKYKVLVFKSTPIPPLLIVQCIGNLLFMDVVVIKLEANWFQLLEEKWQKKSTKKRP
jgi:hypothetical protein